MNWNEQVKEFKKQYNGDENYIQEFIDGLVPQNYYDIMNTALKTKAYLYDVPEYLVGEPIWKSLKVVIFAIYFHQFSEARLEEEEWKYTTDVWRVLK